MISYDGLYALVCEIDGGLRKMRSVAEQEANTPWEYHIPGDLGQVTVTGAGHVVSISLDPRMLRYVNGRALGTALTQTIGHAERDAAQRWRQRIEDVRPRIP
jgi:DNA-binding protein YbaB